MTDNSVDAAPTPPTRRRRRWKRWLAAGVLAATAATATLPWWLPSAWAGRRVAKLVTDASGYPCRIDRVYFRWPARVTLEGIALEGLPLSLAPAAEGTTPSTATATAKRLEASIHVWPLARGRLEGIAAKLSGASLRFAVPAELTPGGDGWATAGLPELRVASPAVPGPVEVRGAITATPERTAVSGVVRDGVDWGDWRFTLSLDPVPLQVTVPDGQWERAGVRAELGGLHAELAAKGLSRPIGLALGGAAEYDPLADRAAAQPLSVKLDAPAIPGYTRTAAAGHLDGAFRLSGLQGPATEPTLAWDAGSLDARLNDGKALAWAKWEAWDVIPFTKNDSGNAQSGIQSPLPGSGGGRGRASTAGASIGGDSTPYRQPPSQPSPPQGEEGLGEQDAWPAEGATVRGGADLALLSDWLVSWEDLAARLGATLPEPFGAATLACRVQWTADGPSGAFQAAWRADAAAGSLEHAPADAIAVVPDDPFAVTGGGAKDSAPPLAALTGKARWRSAERRGEVPFLHLRSAPLSLRLADVVLIAEAEPDASIGRFEAVVRPDAVRLADHFRARLPETAQPVLAELARPETLEAAVFSEASPAPSDHPAWLDGPGPALAVVSGAARWNGAGQRADLADLTVASAPAAISLAGVSARADTGSVVVERIDAVARKEALPLARALAALLPPEAVTAVKALDDPETLAALAIDAESFRRALDPGDATDGNPPDAPALVALALRDIRWDGPARAARIGLAALDSMPASARLSDVTASPAATPAAAVARYDVTVRPEALLAAERCRGLLPDEAASALAALRAPEALADLTLPSGGVGASLSDRRPDGDDAKRLSWMRPDAPTLAVLTGQAEYGGPAPSVRAPYVHLHANPASLRLLNVDASLLPEQLAVTRAEYEATVRPEALALARRLERLLPPEAAKALALAVEPETRAALALPNPLAADDDTPGWMNSGTTPFLRSRAQGIAWKQSTGSVRAETLALHAAPLSAWLAGVSGRAASRAEGSARYELVLRPESLALAERFETLLPPDARKQMAALTEGSHLAAYACGGFDFSPEHYRISPDAALAAAWTQRPGGRADWRFAARPGGVFRPGATFSAQAEPPVPPKRDQYPHLPDAAWPLFDLAGADARQTPSRHPVAFLTDGDNEAMLSLSSGADPFGLALRPDADAPFGWHVAADGDAAASVHMKLRGASLWPFAAAVLPPSKLDSDFVPWYDAVARLDLGVTLGTQAVTVEPRDLVLELLGLEPSDAAGKTVPVGTVRMTASPVSVSLARALAPETLVPAAWKVGIDGEAEALCLLAQRFVRAAPAAWLGLAPGESESRGGEAAAAVDRARTELIASVEAVVARGGLQLAVAGDTSAAEGGAASFRIAGEWRDARVLGPNAGRNAYTRTLFSAPQMGWAAKGSWTAPAAVTLTDAGAWIGPSAREPWLLLQLAEPGAAPLSVRLDAAPPEGSADPAAAPRLFVSARPTAYAAKPTAFKEMLPAALADAPLHALSGSLSLGAGLEWSPDGLTVADGALRLSRDFACDFGPHGRLAPSPPFPEAALSFSARLTPAAGTLPWNVEDGRFRMAGTHWTRDNLGYRLTELAGTFACRDGQAKLDPFTVTVHPTGTRGGLPDARFALALEADLSRPETAPSVTARFRLSNFPLADLVSAFMPEGVVFARGSASLPPGPDAWATATLRPGAAPELAIDGADLEIRDLGMVVTLDKDQRSALATAGMIGHVGTVVNFAASLAGGGSEAKDADDSESDTGFGTPADTSLERILRIDSRGRRAIGFTRIHGRIVNTPSGGFGLDPGRPLVFEGNQSPNLVVTGHADWRPGLDDGPLDLDVRIAKNLRRLMDYDTFLQVALGSVLGAGTSLPTERRAELAHDLADAMERKIEAGELHFPVTGTLKAPNVADGLVAMIKTMLTDTVKQYAAILPKELLLQQLESGLTNQLGGAAGP